MKKTLYMETTGVPAERTAAEVCTELIKAGATEIATRYEDGKVLGLRWTMLIAGVESLFEMPARVEPVYTIFVKRKGYTKGRNDAGAAYWPDLLAKAERVAWRQLLRWVQAQNAMLGTGMVQPMEVFVAYWIPPGEKRTLFQAMMESKFKALPVPETAN